MTHPDEGIWVAETERGYEAARLHLTRERRWSIYERGWVNPPDRRFTPREALTQYAADMGWGVRRTFSPSEAREDPKAHLLALAAENVGTRDQLGELSEHIVRVLGRYDNVEELLGLVRAIDRAWEDQGPAGQLARMAETIFQTRKPTEG